MNSILPGLGKIEEDTGLFDIETGANGLWKVGCEGIERILTPFDRKIDFAVYKDKTLVYVKSAMGYPAIYPLPDTRFEGPAEAVLMDLDGTSVHSESFWMWIIERTTAKLMGNSKFSLEHEDEPYISGHSVSEHLNYCINKYCPDKSVEEARKLYYEITHFEMSEIAEGRGRSDAFKPSKGLKEFLCELKGRNIKIGLVTSGLYEKAWPEILSAFRMLKMGDPLDFYDAIITAGQALKKGQTGTLGELAPKPHPWLYAETARIGLGIPQSKRHKVIGIEDSSAGIISIRLAGFSAIAIGGGNIAESGVRPLVFSEYDTLMDALPIISGK